MAMMICSHCYLSFEGVGTLCPDCAASEGVRARVARDAVLDRNPTRSRSTSSVSATEIAPIWRRCLAGFAEIFFFLPFLAVTFYLCTLPFTSYDYAIVERIIFNGPQSVNYAALQRVALFMSLSIWAQLFVTFVVYVVFESPPLNATPGKMLLALRVVDEKGKGITVWRSLGRNLSRFLLIIPFAALIFGKVLYLIMTHSSLSLIKEALMFLSYTFAMLTMLLLCVGYSWMIFSSKRQCLHDMAANTYVVADASLSATRVLLAIAMGVVGNAVAFYFLGWPS